MTVTPFAWKDRPSLIERLLCEQGEDGLLRLWSNRTGSGDREDGYRTDGCAESPDEDREVGMSAKADVRMERAELDEARSSPCERAGISC